MLPPSFHALLPPCCFRRLAEERLPPVLHLPACREFCKHGGSLDAVVYQASGACRARFADAQMSALGSEAVAAPPSNMANR